MSYILPLLWWVYWQESITDSHWIHTELVCHKVERIYLIICCLHRIDNWCQGYFYNSKKLLHWWRYLVPQLKDEAELFHFFKSIWTHENRKLGAVVETSIVILLPNCICLERLKIWKSFELHEKVSFGQLYTRATFKSIGVDSWLLILFLVISCSSPIIQRRAQVVLSYLDLLLWSLANVINMTQSVNVNV